MSSILSRLPAELHSSAHRIALGDALIGEYELRIYRGVEGPVVLIQETTTSPLPIEYLSEEAVRRFLAALPASTARFFERHQSVAGEAFVELRRRGGGLERHVVSDREFMHTMGSSRIGGRAAVAAG